MIKVSICETEQVYNSPLSSWIKEQYHNRKKAGAEYWFIIKINSSGIKLTLPSEGAPRGRGKPISQFNHRERKIIDLWKEMNAEKVDNIDNLLIFLKRVEQDIN